MTDEELLAELNDVDSHSNTVVLTDDYLKDKLASRDVASARLTTCKGCEFFTPDIYQCQVNRWLVVEATVSSSLTCPEDKWTA
jgi:hypothetical protein